MFLPKAQNTSTSKEVSSKPFHWTQQGTLSKGFYRQVTCSCSILIIPQVHPDGNLGFCSSSWKKSKGKGLAFWCKLSTEFEKSFLLPSNH